MVVVIIVVVMTAVVMARVMAAMMSTTVVATAMPTAAASKRLRRRISGDDRHDQSQPDKPFHECTFGSESEWEICEKRPAEAAPASQSYHKPSSRAGGLRQA